MTKVDIPRKSVYRLSLYQRCLNHLRATGNKTVSSEALAKAAGVKSAQLRKDLGHVGQFGTRGLGYDVGTLSDAITEVLGTARLQPVIIVGVGNLGSALLGYSGFGKEGFEIIAAFDAFPEKVRLRENKLPIYAMQRLGEIVSRHGVKMAILTVPPQVAQSVANVLVEVGIQAILNFSPTLLDVPEHVFVNQVDLAIELENLSYFIR